MYVTLATLGVYKATRLAGTATNDNTSLQAVQYISATSMTDLDRDDEV
jgi:hypothetical protein